MNVKSKDRTSIAKGVNRTLSLMQELRGATSEYGFSILKFQQPFSSKNSDIKMRAILILLLHVSFNFATCQISGIWHNSVYDHPFSEYRIKFKGNVKSWTMTRSDGRSRIITLDECGEIVTDTYTGTIQTGIPRYFWVFRLKNQLEISYPFQQKEDTNSIYNDRMQLLMMRGGFCYEKNQFDDSGRILIHQKSCSIGKIYIDQRGQRGNNYIDKYEMLVLYKYNMYGNPKEISYFDSEPTGLENIKIEFTYDENQNVVERRFYEDQYVPFEYKFTNYLDTFMQSEIDTSFLIENYYPNFWKRGPSSIVKWKYNYDGKKVEYNFYGRSKAYRIMEDSVSPSFSVKWEYDGEGNLEREIHFGENRIVRIIKFDPIGNVIHETKMGYNGRNDLISEMKIIYY